MGFLKINSLEINGLIIKEGGSEFSHDEFFNKLEEMGYEYTGSYAVYSDAQMADDINKIVYTLSSDKLSKMKAIHDNHYGENGISTIEEFLLCNTGTGIYEKVFVDTLDGDALELYKKYAHANWQVSDVFEGDLSEAVVVKMKEFKLI